LGILVVGAGALVWSLYSEGGAVTLAVSTNVPDARITVGGNPCAQDCQPALAPGRYEVRAERAGYRPASINVEIGSAQPAPVQLVLDPLPSRLLVSTNFARGTVTLDGGGASALRNGEFVADSLAPGTHTLAVQSPDGRATVRFETAPGSAPRLLDAPSLTEAQAVVVSGLAGSSAEIRCDCSSGAVSIDGNAAGNLDNGRLALNPLNPGTHEILVTAPDGQRNSLVALQAEPSLNVFLTADRNIGTLVVETGQDDVAVFINNRRQPSVTRQGLMRLPMPVGAYTVRVEKSGYRPPLAQQVNLAKGALERVSFQLQPADAMLAIRDALPGARVQIDGRPAGVVQPDGTLRTVVTPGPHTIELARDGYSPRTTRLEFGPGATVGLGRGDVELTENRPPPSPPPPVTPVKPAPPDPRVVEAEEWARLSNTRNIEQLEEFRRKYPNGANSEQAARRIEQLDWENIQGRTDAAAYEGYLRKYPNGPNADLARRRIEEIEWAGVNRQDAAAIRAFLQRHPNSPLSGQANAALASLQQADRLAADRRAVTQALARMEQAYGSRNVQSLTAVWPSIPGATLQTLRETFRIARAIELQLRPIRDPEISGDTAVVQCQRLLRQTFEGRQPLTNQGNVTIRLRRSGDSWLIQDIN
jgi:hypothetical protein